MEAIHKQKAEKIREKAIADQFEARRAKNKSSRARKLERRETRFAGVSHQTNTSWRRQRIFLFILDVPRHMGEQYCVSAADGARRIYKLFQGSEGSDTRSCSRCFLPEFKESVRPCTGDGLIQPYMGRGRRTTWGWRIN